MIGVPFGPEVDEEVFESWYMALMFKHPRLSHPGLSYEEIQELPAPFFFRLLDTLEEIMPRAKAWGEGV